MKILSPNLKEVLTLREVGAYLRVDPHTVRRSESTNTYTHFSRDKQNRRLFKKSDIESYLQKINKNSGLQQY